MHKKLATLLAVLGLSLTLGCSTLGHAQTFAENPRFLRSGSVLGLTEKELIEKIGLPIRKEEAGSCTAPLVVDGTLNALALVEGKAWIYKTQENEYIAALDVCFVNGHVVGTHREFSQMTDQVFYHLAEDNIDLELIRRAVAGELDGSPVEERRSPVYDGPEYAI